MKKVEIDIDEASIRDLYRKDAIAKNMELDTFRKSLAKKYHPVIVNSLSDRFIRLLRPLPTYDIDVFFKMYEHDFTPTKQFRYERTKRVSIVIAIILLIGASLTAMDYFSTLYMAKFYIYPTLLFHLFLLLIFGICSVFVSAIVTEARNTLQSQSTIAHTNNLVAEEVLKKVKSKQLGRLAVYRKLTGALHSYSVDNFNETFDEYNKHTSRKKVTK